MVCVCEVCPESRNLLQNDKEQKKQATKPEADLMSQELLVLFNLSQAKDLNITMGSTVHVSPPWFVQFIYLTELLLPPSYAEGNVFVLSVSVQDIT